MNIEELIEELTIEEKCSLLVGKNVWETNNIDRLNIPSIFMADGPHGLRKVVNVNNTVETIAKAVCYPSLVTLASSFDPKLAYKMGVSIGKDCLSQGVNVILGPGINIKRHPFCGRNFEYFSEDPFVTTKMAEGFINGVKSQKIGVCIKHYALNSQEDYRMTSSSIVDKRAKYEIYYKSFMELVKLEPEMVMCSYNKVDGIYASENINLLQEVLREEFGFNGVIVSDWGAVNVRTKALIASLDLEMPGHQYNVIKLLNGYKEDNIALETIDNSVRRILSLINKFKEQEIKETDLDKNHNISSNIAAESMVLLKNSDDLLPLKMEDRILLIGDMAKNIRYQGGGSSHINSHKVDAIYDFLSKHEHVDYLQGYCNPCNELDNDLLYEIKNLAPNYNKIIIVCGLTEQYESEGYDREHLSIPKNQEFVINQVSNLNKNIVLVMQMGSPVVMPFIHNVKAILNCYLSGEGLGYALDRVLFGKFNPSGRLAETFPENYSDVSSDKYYKTGNNNAYYQESIYVGYRYYTSNNLKVLFPFGYGLSYSHFEYSNMAINKDKLTTQKQNINISIDVTNNGPVDGKEVILLFFEAKNPETPRPKRELIGFDKVLIKNG
ncbi:MAG: glycoside hydrolase family 3 C-terminal domain-containing protein, partial [Tenericutes bacterium]|nr:glycoside hydrolase family 3 C-terminal domain-containing protein [Mycoplasmatota bacterium]